MSELIEKMSGKFKFLTVQITGELVIPVVAGLYEDKEAMTAYVDRKLDLQFPGWQSWEITSAEDFHPDFF